MAPIYGTRNVIMFGGLNETRNLNDTWIWNDKPKLYKNGIFESTPIFKGSSSTLKTIEWEAIVPNGTSLKFQLRSARDRGLLEISEYFGPCGGTNTYYETSGMPLWFGCLEDEWIQIKGYFNSSNIFITPRLKDITISYNLWPITKLTNPPNGAILANNQPMFEWEFIDSDSTGQTAFQVVIEDNKYFIVYEYDSSIQNSEGRQMVLEGEDQR
jgi:hypothetical protein